MWNRIVGLLVAIAAMTATERGLGFERYWAFLFGVLAYFIVRYVGYVIRERRINAETEAAMLAMAERRQNSN